MAVVTGVQRYVLWFSFSQGPVISSIFSRAYLQSLRKCLLHFFNPFLNWGIFLLMTEFRELLNVVWTQVSMRYVFCEYFSPCLGLLFHFLNNEVREVHVSNFVTAHAFSVSSPRTIRPSRGRE